MSKFLNKLKAFVVSHQALEKEIGRLVLARMIAVGLVSGIGAALLEALLR